MMAPDPILVVENLTMRFGGRVAIDALSFEARHGDITAISGTNGGGKTTEFDCFTGVCCPTGGGIAVRRQDGTRDALHRLIRHRIGKHARVARIFRNIRLFGGTTVIDDPTVAPHNRLMREDGRTASAPMGPGPFRHREAAAVERARPAGPLRSGPARRRPGRLAALGRRAAAGDRARCA